MLDRATLSKIRKFAIQTDWNISFGGKARGNKHLFRVVKIAKFLAKKLNADVAVVEAGALLHDIVLPSGKEFDYYASKKLAKKLLKSFALSPRESNSVAECIASHEGIIKPKTLEAKIVHDADVLEKVGLLGIIRHTWKITNLKKLNHEKIKDKDVKRIIDHIDWRRKRLQTPIARRIGAYLKMAITKKKAKAIVSLVASMAFTGIVTEKIAVELNKHPNHKENEKLKEQLNLGYLRKFS